MTLILMNTKNITVSLKSGPFELWFQKTDFLLFQFKELAFYFNSERITGCETNFELIGFWNPFQNLCWLLSLES